MKIILKLVSFIVVVVLVMALLPSCSNEESGGNVSEEDAVADIEFEFPTRKITDETEYTEGSYIYLLYDDGTAAIKQHTGEEIEIEIPETLGGHKVVTIGSEAFYDNQNATSVKIPSTVETIGSLAFSGCVKLETINIPASVWEIYTGAFTDTPWLDKQKDKEFVIVGDSVLLKYNGTKTTVVIPNTVKHISDAFYGNTIIKDVTVPNSVLTIGACAFNSSEVLRVTLGKNVAWLGYSSFAYCSQLMYINIPNSVKRIDDAAFVSCSSLKFLKLGKGVEYIGAEAFYRASQINYVYLPKSLLQKDSDGKYRKTIGDGAFYDCGSLLYVFFEGSEADFENLGLSGSNFSLTDADKKFNYSY